jgi:hypothetical protein
MYIRKRHVRAWATIPAIVLVIAISVIAGPANAATYTTQVPLGAAGPFAVLAATAVTASAPTTVTLNVGSTAAQFPVAVVTISRLPSTSTNDAYQPLKPVNFVQGFALGFALVLIGWLLLLGLRRSA